MTEVILTNHAKLRMKQRMGLKRSAWQRMAQRAYDRGIPDKDLKGKLKRYVAMLYLAHKAADNIRIHGKYIYLFYGHVLVTVFLLPKNMEVSLIMTKRAYDG